MAINPFDEITKRAAQLNALKTDAPVSTTQPVPDPNKALPAVGATVPDAGGLLGHRDQWSAPSNVRARGDFGRLAGYDANKFNSGEQTLKYQAGNIFTGFDPRGGVGQLFSDEEFKRLYPNARQMGDDKIDWGYGDAPVDVIQGYGGDNPLWAWQPQDAGGGTPSASAPAQAGMGPQSNLAGIMEEIQALSNGTQSPNKRKAIMDLLMDPALQQEAL